MTKTLAVACLCLLASELNAQRFVSMLAGTSGPPHEPQGTFWIGTATIGSSAIEPLFSASFLPGDAAQAIVLRDRMIPDDGITNVAKRARVNGQAAFRVFHQDTVQFWASVDGASWQLIEPDFERSSPSLVLWVGTTFVQFSEVGNNSFRLLNTPENAPAIGDIGIVILAALVLVAGAWIMRRRNAGAACFAALCIFPAGNAFGGTPGQVVSYFARQVSATELTVIPVVPPGGLVLTDVIYGENRTGPFELVEQEGLTRTTKARFQMTAGVDDSWRFRSGIPLKPGTSILVVIPSNDTIGVTLSGYVPTASGNAPAVGNIGLIFLVFAIVAAGGYVIAKRRPGWQNCTAEPLRGIP